MLAKSANQAFKMYAASGGTLTFTQFLHREKEKLFYSDGQAAVDQSLLLVNQSLNDSVQSAINDIIKKSGNVDQETGKTIFGIPKWLVIGSGITLLAATAALIVIKKTQTA